MADEDHSESSDDASGDEFNAPLKDESKDDDDAEKDDVVAESELPGRTPLRKRKRARATTLQTPRRTETIFATTIRRRRGKDASLAQPTPHTKTAQSKREKTVCADRPPPATAGMLDMDESAVWGLGEDPWWRAMHVLHVAARPGTLPCRRRSMDGCCIRSRSCARGVGGVSADLPRAVDSGCGLTLVGQISQGSQGRGRLRQSMWSFKS